MKLLAIINPISGYARSRQLPLALEDRLRQEGFDLHIHLTRHPGDGRECARQYAKNYDLIIVAGGDGTISEVANGLFESKADTPFTILPTGTENLLAKELKIRPDIDQIVETIKWGKKVSLDVIKANERIFLLVSGVGFDAKVLLHLNSFRRGNITHLTYFWPIWRTFWEYKFEPITIHADDKLVVRNAPALAFVTNIARYSIGLRICKFARYDDGLMDLCVYLCEDQFELLAHAWRTIWKKHTDNENVIYMQAKKIRIESEYNLPFETDGDPSGYLPVEYKIIPNRINILVPLF